MRVYMDGRLIVSTRQRKVLALDDVVSDLEEGTGPTDCGGWLVDVCDALTDHSSEFIEQLHDKIIDLEDNLLDQQIPRINPGSAAQTINSDASLYGTAT